MIINHLATKRGAWSTIQGAILPRRAYSEGAAPKPRSAHAQWYSDTVPAMIPIFLLGSVVYLGLQLAQQKLSHEKFMEDASVRVKALETEVDALQETRASTRDATSALRPDVKSKPKNSSWW